MYIIEHQTRGTFREWDGNTPRWSWSGKRNDPEKAYQFQSGQEALKTFHKIKKQSNQRFGSLLSIRDSNNEFKEVDPASLKPVERRLTMEEFTAYVKTYDRFTYSDVERMLIQALRLYDEMMNEDRAKEEAEKIIVADHYVQISRIL